MESDILRDVQTHGVVYYIATPKNYKISQTEKEEKKKTRKKSELISTLTDYFNVFLAFVKIH